MSANTSLLIGLGALGILLVATMSDSPPEKKSSITDTKKTKVEPKKVVL